MKGGPELFDKAERALTEAGIGRNDKADLLTGMALLSGLVSRELPQRLLSRRRDIMMESVAYEMIKKEGYEEGMQQGMQQGDDCRSPRDGQGPLQERIICALAR
jgi:hypothetical protein